MLNVKYAVTNVQKIIILLQVVVGVKALKKKCFQ